MTVPTSIPETPMAHSDYESIQESKNSNGPRSMEILQHVLQTVLNIKDEEDNNSFSKWMKNRGYDNFPHICADFCHILDRIHDYLSSEQMAEEVLSSLAP